MMTQTRTLPTAKTPLLSGARYEVPWDGTPLSGRLLAFDVETDIVDLSREVPRLALCGVSDGQRHVLVTPEQMHAFILAHSNRDWIGFNVAFDWHVVHRHVKHRAITAAYWEKYAERLHDAMLLDFLVRLAGGAEVGAFSHRGLGECCQDRLGVFVDKADPYRMRFGELIGRAWSDPTIEEGFWTYAIKDVILTYHLAVKLLKQAAEIRKAHNAAVRWGILTERLQTRASLVLADIGRNGMCLDSAQVDVAAERLKAEVDAQVAALRSFDPGLFDYYKLNGKNGERPGDYKVNKGTGVPKLQVKVLRPLLAKVAEERGLDPDTLPRTEKTHELATGLDLWRERAGDHPLVAAWTKMADTSKVLQFVVKVRGQTSVHPHYRVLVRTGRTSCTDPNIQQMPREPWFRALFTARPGHRLVIVDYSAIELRTLAAVCLSRYGRSVLADTIRAGRDPHVYTAALIGGMTYEQFLGLKTTDTVRFKKDRQAAKAVNFGVPGGLGAAKLAAYAKANYGVALTEEQAGQFRDRLTAEVYPELTDYLSDDAPGRMAKALGCPVSELHLALEIEPGEESIGLWRAVENIIMGGCRKKSGALYSPAWRQRVWDGLCKVNRNPALIGPLARWEGGPALHRRLCADTAVTLTGRVRGGLGYTEARNTPFQGLAADGAKAALWRLWREGHRIVAFVHDEVVTEVLADQAQDELARVSRVMSEEMALVLQCDLPVEVEGHISERWGKS